MAKVFTKAPGSRMRIDCFGEATSEHGVEVPDSIGEELSQVDSLQVVFDGEPVPQTTYHAVGGKVYHTLQDCSVGNNIEYPVPGDGGLPHCETCQSREISGEKE